MADVFISYAREDRRRAEHVAGLIGRQGLSVWWDRKLTIGQSFSEMIEKELAQARCVVVLWSSSSIRSDWVLSEAAEGARRKALIPILIENVQPPFEFRRLHAASVFDERRSEIEDEFEACVAAIRSILRDQADERSKTDVSERVDATLLKSRVGDERSAERRSNQQTQLARSYSDSVGVSGATSRPKQFRWGLAVLGVVIVTLIALSSGLFGIKASGILVPFVILVLIVLFMVLVTRKPRIR